MSDAMIEAIWNAPMILNPNDPTDTPCRATRRGIAVWVQALAIKDARRASPPDKMGLPDVGVAGEALLKLLADAWDAYGLALAQTNAAIPAINSTPAERAVYDERYRVSEEAKREMYRVAWEAAKSARAAIAALPDVPVAGEDPQARRHRMIDALWSVYREQSADSAPRDGSYVLLYYPDEDNVDGDRPCVLSARWGGDRYFKWCGPYSDGHLTDMVYITDGAPTHWMTFPVPPAPPKDPAS